MTYHLIPILDRYCKHLLYIVDILLKLISILRIVECVKYNMFNCQQIDRAAKRGIWKKSKLDVPNTFHDVDAN